MTISIVVCNLSGIALITHNGNFLKATKNKIQGQPKNELIFNVSNVALL